MVELKPYPDAEYILRQTVSQSYHGGIETEHPCFQLERFALSQSYHGGIETATAQKITIQRLTPNRTMVELKQCFTWLIKSNEFTPNRTMVELKPNCLSFVIIS